jgi:hypothetical protein
VRESWRLPPAAGAEPQGRPLGEGASGTAPTAPHATPRVDDGSPTGPERFWARAPVRVALAICVVMSALLHGSFLPMGLPHRFERNEVEGEAAIPVDVLSATDLPSASAAAPAALDEPPAEPAAEKEPPAASVHSEALPRHDAGLADGSPDARAADAAGPVSDARANKSDAASDQDGAMPLGGGDAGTGGPRDPEAVVGAAGAVQADVTLVMVIVNTEVIRAHPVGAKLGYLLRAIPQWDQFMKGTDLDPVRDTDWLMISGPSLVDTSRDVVLVHYSASDAIVDRAVDVVSRQYARGGPFDAGVPGVKASLAHADRAERVVLRAQPHVLVVLPPAVARREARKLASARVPAHVRPGEAMYLRLVDPHHPFPEFPEAVTEARMRVVPRPDGGADVRVDCDTKTPEAAAGAVDAIKRLVRRHNDTLTSLFTHGLLDGVDVAAQGTTVTVHLTATLDQIETLVTLVGDFLGVSAPEPLAPPPSPTAAPVPLPRSPSNPWPSR